MACIAVFRKIKIDAVKKKTLYDQYTKTPIVKKVVSV